jgi:hypothetical protein
MAKFTMTLDLEVHDHSPSAHRAFIGTALDHVKLAVGRGVDTEGEIITPAIGAVREAVVGSWKISEEAAT